MWKLNGILFSTYGIIPGQVDNEGLAIKGIFDLPKRLGTTHKDWDDQDSVEPYVDADEIFLQGRDLSFQGILEGTKSQTEANIEWLKLDISNLNSIVPFETPYGTYCVYVNKITSKLYKGIATVLIELREPEVGATCSIGGMGSIFYSDIYSETAKKNNCAVGYYGLEVSLASTQGQFSSTISQLAANQLAVNWVRENKQNNANAGMDGTYCLVNPPIFFNQEQSKTLQRDNCANGFTGSSITRTIDADVYSSDGRTDPTASQSKADQKAMDALDLILTQSYANSIGTCEFLVSFERFFTDHYIALDNDSHAPRGTTVRRDYFRIGNHMEVGTKYNMTIYGVINTVISADGDTPNSIVEKLMTLVNDEPNWDLKNQKGASDINPVALNFAILGGYGTLMTKTSGFARPQVWIGEPVYFWNLDLQS